MRDNLRDQEIDMMADLLHSERLRGFDLGQTEDISDSRVTFVTENQEQFWNPLDFQNCPCW